ncbi:SAM-dependent methyltransferase [Gammaproteobacteria bacterium]|nr:SAM-dependent methyltransferase [Gammaproteobacteria bacterium]
MTSPVTPQGLEIPLPDDAAIEHSMRLVNAIIERIEQRGGVIGFDEYMEMALYQPGLGYYSASLPKFGAAGDFVTAPEISSLFGYCLARQADALIAQGCAAEVLEFGAGSGKLCAQILESLPALAHYRILDLSADLRQRQQQYLEERLSTELFHKIEWLEHLPTGFDGIVLANEVLDAMPVHVLKKQDDWQEQGVTYRGQGFEWQAMALTEAVGVMRRIESKLGELPRDYRSELNLNYQPWLKALAESCRRAIVLIIDYGYEQAQYYHAARQRGTLICHLRHRVHDDPFVYPGLQDITAFVDFDACADAAEASGFNITGLIGQGQFLLANGLLEEAQRRAGGVDPMTQLAISQQVATLSLPQEMGEKFKVLALQKDLALDIPALRRGRAYG